MAINYPKYLDSTGTHWIANSGHDENGRYHGGQAGDQTGHEAELKAWYNRPWTVVLRYPDPAVGLQIAKLEIAMCLNPKVGYDQYQRVTYWKELVAADYDPSAIATPCEQDCTGGTTANVKAAGHILGIQTLEDIPVDTYSGNMKARFTKAGFRALTDSKYLTGPKYLLPGDVLLYEGHHAAVNITRGSKAGKAEAKPAASLKLGDRVLKNGMSGEDVKELQLALIKLGYDCGKWGADGQYGDATEMAVKSFQRDHGLDVDGEAGPLTLAAMTNADKRFVRVTAEAVNVRRGPGTQYGILGVVRRGDRLPYQGQTFANGWHLVEYNGQNAAISGAYTEVC